MATTITDPNPTPEPDRPRLYQPQLQRLLQMTPNDFVILECWLQGREKDIASGHDGLGVLSSVFRALMGREASA